MILPNYNDKALVPYRPSKMAVVSSYFNLLFDSRKYVYIVFLCLFFASSAFSRCIFVYNSEISELLYDDLSYSNAINKFFLVNCALAFVAYLSSFTTFVLPISLIAASHTFYLSSFVCFTVINGASFGLFNGLCILLVFALYSVLSVVFYTEQVKGRNNGVLGIIVSAFVFAVYVAVLHFFIKHLISFVI